MGGRERERAPHDRLRFLVAAELEERQRVRVVRPEGIRPRAQRAAQERQRFLRPFVRGERRRQVALHLDPAAVGRERARQEPDRLLVVPGFQSHRAEAVQRLGVIGLYSEHLAQQPFRAAGVARAEKLECRGYDLIRVQGAARYLSGLILLGRDVARGDVGAGAEEMALGLLHEVFARALVGEVEAVLVHQHGLLLEPLRPRLFRDAFPDALAERAGIRREIEPFGLAAAFYALHHSRHRENIFA